VGAAQVLIIFSDEGEGGGMNGRVFAVRCSG
jgi:hypothetical protein